MDQKVEMTGKKYGETLQKLREQLAPRSGFEKLREKALARFQELGFPNSKNEDWKYTSVAQIAKTPFRTPTFAPSLDVLSPFVTMGKWDFYSIVFVNGFYVPELSSSQFEKGVQVESLSEVLKKKPEWVDRHLASSATFDANPFVALNTAFFQEGAFVRVESNRRVEKPIHLFFISISSDEPTSFYPRVCILLEEKSRAKIIENYVGLDAGEYLVNSVTEVSLAENAHLEHLRIQRESLSAFHVGQTSVSQREKSGYISHAINLGSTLGRNGIEILLKGKESSCTLNGLYLGGGTQHLDNHTVIRHLQPECRSTQYYKGILGESAAGVFYGKIHVPPHSQKTDAIQNNKNLLLSNDAVVYSRPQLEIYTDDVKCTHGSATGQLDEDAVFYLRSRGISEAEAKNLLTYAFASEVVERISLKPIVDFLENHLNSLFLERAS